MTSLYHVSLHERASPGDDEGVRLLWTSGWDSTFQLLRLLLKHRLVVTPYYLEDPTRPSTATELQSLQRITDALHARHPHTRDLLRPLRRFRVAELDHDADIADALRRVRRHMYIGSQYAWLPQFCRQHGIDGIELSVHVDDKVQALLSSKVEAFEQADTYRSFRLSARHAGTPEYTLFRHFSFPLFPIDKRAMQDEAAREGWSALMDMTWFCHRPWRGRPCGACAPCVYTIEEGLAWRVPRTRRALSFVYRTLALPLKPPLRSALATLGLRGARS
ncbi:hypothetical protein LJR143_003719 [Pseudoxanthomonas sp. LjRoot143]|uniref:hypothetical protein n=1 Tax=Pseudoxanthomonas sp. LjRoot143 TaxID=3342266 RepID=UPI003ECF7680